MEEIALTASMHSSLLNLQGISGLVSVTQNRLSTGLKVNSAIENPASYYTAKSLNNRAADLSNLLDSMGSAVSTIKAASAGLQAGADYLEAAAAVAAQALLDNNFLSSSSSKDLLQQLASDTSLSAIASVLAQTLIDNGYNADMSLRDLSKLSATASFPQSAAEASAANQIGKSTKSIADLQAEGYKVIKSGMSAVEISSLLVDNAKLVLADDITLDKGLEIKGRNIIIEGYGHSITFNSGGSEEAALHLDGENTSVAITNLSLKAAGNKVYGIRVTNGAKLTIDNLSGFSISGNGAQKIVSGDADMFDGKSNTEAILQQIGDKALAASATNQYYVGSKNNVAFGQGQWYLPAIGELMNAYGFDYKSVTNGNETSGATGENRALVNAALNGLKAKGVNVDVLNWNNQYWTSSETTDSHQWKISLDNGFRYPGPKSHSYGVRAFVQVNDVYDPLSSSAQSGVVKAPKIGDVMYADKTYGSAADYDGTKVVVGVVTDLSPDGSSVTVMAAKELSFGDDNSFDADNPYGGSKKHCIYSAGEDYVDIIDNKNFGSDQLRDAAQSLGSVTVTNTPFKLPEKEDANPIPDPTPTPTPRPERPTGVKALEYEYGNSVDQYNKIIRDSTYKGINLLRQNSLTVTFNESRSSHIVISGYDMSAESIGLKTLSWRSAEDIVTSLHEISDAVSQIRETSTDLGNYLGIVSNRQSFTSSIMNILTAGADNLTLADMNEESANMLALQTRQQLAVTALSLSSDAARGILSLFA